MSVSTEKSIFLDALDIEPPTKRSDFLSSACGGDGRLRAAVDELLRAHARDDNPLDAPLVEFNGTLEQPTVAGSSPAVTLDFTPVRNLINEEIGPYRLMEQIGEGGFGLVFVAQQQRPVRRRVALKVIKPGMDTREVIARFEAERQALALMDHPHIAQVYDAGTTDEGRPYFVMELVRGVPITEFCDHHKLSTAERLELFVTVCRAVQHAHQKGVIHRDLKPSNVLVTLHDGAPVAKVIDFGVAKAIGQRMTDKTIYTRFTAMIGTPLYMSPEQAEMSGQDIDTRADIYSLGVILYELLTGFTPFDSARLQSAGLDEMRRIIREEEPPRPSTRLSTLGEALSTVSATRRIEPSRLPALVRGDLDWIAMKAMDKARSRRYESASALATDVQRYLREEPVEARPPSTAYRFQKFARRNRGLFTSAALIAAAMLVGTSVSVWQAVRATAERNEKSRALDDATVARQEADEAKRQVEQFSDHLKEATLLTATGQAHADAEGWLEAHADYSRATELLPDYFLVWIERGAFYVRLGLWERAAHDYVTAIELGAVPYGPSWRGVPQLFAFLGEHEHHQQLCADILQKSMTDEDLTFDNLRALVLAPSTAVKASTLLQQADKMVSGLGSEERYRGGPPPRPRDDDGPPPLPRRPPNGPGEEQAFGPPRRNGGPDRRGPPEGVGEPPRGPQRGRQPRSPRLYIAGLTYYRANQIEQAIELLEHRDAGDRSWPSQGLHYPVLAMAYHRAGRDEDADRALTEAGHKYSAWAEQMSNGPVGSMPIPWFDWVEFLVLYREASELIVGEAPLENEALEQVKQRALAAIAESQPTTE